MRHTGSLSVPPDAPVSQLAWRASYGVYRGCDALCVLLLHAHRVRISDASKMLVHCMCSVNTSHIVISHLTCRLLCRAALAFWWEGIQRQVRRLCITDMQLGTDTHPAAQLTLIGLLSLSHVSQHVLICATGRGGGVAFTISAQQALYH